MAHPGGLDAQGTSLTDRWVKKFAVIEEVASKWKPVNLSALQKLLPSESTEVQAQRELLSEGRKTVSTKTKDFAITDPLAKLASQAILNYNPQSGYFAAERTLQFHQEINEHNHAKAWKNTNTKVLAIYGESDIAANNKYDTEEIARYINELRPGTAQFMFVPKTNHTFQKIGTMQDFVKLESEDPAKYQLFALSQFNHDLFKDIDVWLNNNL